MFDPVGEIIHRYRTAETGVVRMAEGNRSCATNGSAISCLEDILLILQREFIAKPRQLQLDRGFGGLYIMATALPACFSAFLMVSTMLITETLAYTLGSADHRFILQCVLCAGKVIDRNIAPGTPSFAKAMELDEEMDKIAACMPTGWWNIPDESTGIGTDLELDALRERLLQQFYFFHVKMYIHLPFLAKSTSALSASKVSKLACMNSARQMLARFQLLCTEVVHGTYLFECKTSDFVGFMAATVLLIGLSTSNMDNANALHHQDDLRLVKTMEENFEREKHESKLAAQYWMTLRVLSQALRNSHTETSNMANEIQEINIPYFGVVVRKSVRYAPEPSLPANLDGSSAAVNSDHSSCNEATTISATPATSGFNVRTDERMIDYWGYELPDLVPGSHPSSEPFEFSSNGTTSSWLDPMFFDIDQDWGSLLEIDH